MNTQIEVETREFAITNTNLTSIQFSNRDFVKGVNKWQNSALPQVYDTKKYKFLNLKEISCVFYSKRKPGLKIETKVESISLGPPETILIWINRFSYCKICILKQQLIVSTTIIKNKLFLKNFLGNMLSRITIVETGKNWERSLSRPAGCRFIRPLDGE